MPARYPPGLLSQLQAMLAGFADQTSPPVFPDVSIAELTALKDQLAATEAQARAAHAVFAQERDQRDAVGVQARAAYAKMCGYLRTYYKGQPGMLVEFGLEPKRVRRKAEGTDT